MSPAAKAKKLARKAETALANEHVAIVRAANASDPFAQLPASARAFTLAPPAANAANSANANATTSPLQVRLVSASASDLSPKMLDAAHALCRANMEELYEPVWGPWDEAKKRRQLADGASRFILAFAETAGGAAAASAATTTTTVTATAEKLTNRVDSSSPEDQGAPPPANADATPDAADTDQQQQLVAIVNYRFELDDAGGTGRGPALPVAYCYEVQLLPSVQRRGLGRKLMRALELCAARAGMRGVVLTVLDENVGARSLYAALGYVLDQNSPDPDDYEEAHAGYRILRKDFPEGVVKAAAAARAVATAAEAGAAKAAPTATAAAPAAATAASK